MSKSKRKAKQQNFLQYFLNEFIFFRRDFSFVTQLSPEQAANNLRQLNFENQGCQRQRRIIAEVVDGFSEYSFEVKAEQPSKTSYIQSAKAKGRIFSDEDGMSIVEGSVTTNWEIWVAVVLLAFIFTIASIFQANPPVFMISLLAIIFLVFWIRMYHDRNYLIQIIDYAINGDKAKHINNSR